MANKMRIDQLIVDRGLIESREKAKRSIMAGLVFSNGQRIDKLEQRFPMILIFKLKVNYFLMLDVVD